VASFEDSDGRTQVAVVKPGDGAYRVFVSTLSFDDEEQVFYWSDDLMPTGGIYQTIDIARTEMEILIGPLRDTVGASPERDTSLPSSA
jgi:hypothetical protein